MEHVYNLRTKERGIESPLATKRQRDRLLRKPLREIVNDESLSDADADIQNSSHKEKVQTKDAERNQAKKTASAAELIVSPPDMKHLTSSPTNQHDKSVGILTSPHFSIIEADRTSTSASSAVNELKAIRRSHQTSDSDETVNKDDEYSSNVSQNISSRSMTSDVSQNTPKRQHIKPIKRSLSQECALRANNLPVKPDPVETSRILQFVFIVLIPVAIVLIAWSEHLWPVSLDGFFRSDHTYTEQEISEFRMKFSSQLKLLKDDFPGQEMKTWAVIGSSIKSVLSENRTMPACILIIGEANMETPNCLASRLSKAFHQSLFGATDDSLPLTFKPLDSMSYNNLEVDESKQNLFRELKSKLETDHVATIFNVQKLNGHVAMSLHSFCDESTTSFPLSTIFMTIENESGELAANKTPEHLGDVLLNKAWGEELGPDKVASLISRVAVSVAKIVPEAKNVCQD